MAAMPNPANAYRNMVLRFDGEDSAAIGVAVTA